MDSGSFDSALRTYYSTSRLAEIQMRDRPLLSYLLKDEKFFGRDLTLPVMYGDPQNISSQFAVAQSHEAEGTTGMTNFRLTRTNLYNLVTISTDVMESSASMGATAWLSARTTEIDNALEAVSDRLATLCYRAGWGEVASVGAVSGSTITLAVISDTANIKKDMYLGFSSALSGVVLRGSAGGGVGGQYLKVLGVNTSTGVVTFTTPVANVTGGGGAVTAGDFVFTQGDRQDLTTADPVRRVICGLEGWCPAGGATNTNFFGVDRSVDSRLGGVSYNGTSEAPEDAILAAASQMAENGASPTHAFCSFRQFAKISKALKTAVRYTDQLTATIGFTGLQIATAGGIVKLVPDRFCPANRAFLINKDSVKLYSMKKAVRVIDNDGLQVLRQPSADGVEVRVGFKGQLGAANPAGIANVQLAVA